MNFLTVIPARYASTRFPGKPLALLGGKTVIQRVYEQALKVMPEVYVATDDQRIFDAVTAFGGKVVMTAATHKSGTDRIEEAVRKITQQNNTTYDVIINIQGDEPFIQPTQIRELMQCFDDERTEIATLGIPFSKGSNGTDTQDVTDATVNGRETAAEDTLKRIKNPNSPKIAVSLQGFALYFSRSVIPYCRGKEEAEWPASYPYLKHIGLYAYRREVLGQVTALPQSPLEVAESLEQLRWLENGYRIKVAKTEFETIGIDTPDDLAQAEAFLSTHQA